MRPLLFSIMLFVGSFSISQNLVPNPSFEEYIDCPEEVGEIPLSWVSYRESPDYFNTCSSSSLVSVPNNLAGQQSPFSGNGYAGIQTFFTTDFREYIGIQLSQNLEAGHSYSVSFKTALARGGIIEARCANNKIGLKFSTIPFDTEDPAPIDNFAHIFSDQIITDSINWTTISGTFTADSSYGYLILGNFFDDNNTDTIIYENSCRAYYYLDDVKVIKNSSTGIIDPVLYEVKVFPVPAHEKLFIESSISYDEIHVFNNTGVLIEMIENKMNKTHTEIDLSSYQKGVYYFKIKINDDIINKIVAII